MVTILTRLTTVIISQYIFEYIYSYIYIYIERERENHYVVFLKLICHMPVCCCLITKSCLTLLPPHEL